MKSAICTLFEGKYHYGVGALVNSLYFHGYQGTVWVGYRGKLPPWAHPLETAGKYQKFRVGKGCIICFIKLDTTYHFTNYKPTFMLDLLENYCRDVEAIFYFDPDIVTKCRWSFFEEWAGYGVALCEDINSPMPPTHPFRMAWRKMYEPHGFNLNSSIDTYVNGGFIGVKKDEVSFLVTWSKIQNILATEIGGLEHPKVHDRTSMLRTPDQEALNIALMHFKEPVSLIGKEGMDFIHSGFTMSHAIGSRKPWNKNMALSALLSGRSPRLADKEYWKHTQQPIQLYSKPHFLRKKIDLSIGSIIGRIL